MWRNFSAWGGADRPAALLSLSIVSHGQSEIVRLLLADLRSCLSPGDEVFLTLNIHEPFAPSQYPFQLRILKNAVPKGFAANHNAAFRQARGDLFCVLNPDIRITANPFPALRACIEADSQVAACAPLIVSPRGIPEDSLRRLPTPSVILKKLFGAVGVPDYDLRGPVIYPDWIAGMFIVFRREAFAAAGGFDERYFLYYEDVDLGTRLRLTGWRLAACAEARAIHDARRQSRRSLRYLRWHVSSMLRFFFSPAYRRARRAATRQEAR